MPVSTKLYIHIKFARIVQNELHGKRYYITEKLIWSFSS